MLVRRMEYIIIGFLSDKDSLSDGKLLLNNYIFHFRFIDSKCELFPMCFFVTYFFLSRLHS